MVMQYFSILDKKKDPKYWRQRLSEAHQLLWQRDLNRAEKVYAEILADLQKRKDVNRILYIWKPEVQLGLWAINYLRNTERLPEYIPITADLGDSHNVWHFIVRVLQMQQDTRPEALSAYLAHLQGNPTEKNARALLPVYEKVSFSELALQLLEEMGNILSNDPDTVALLIKWYLKAGQTLKAVQTAEHVLEMSPHNIEAHRYLGFQAEKCSEWKTARKHYQQAGEWLRLAVVCFKDGDRAATQQALEAVPQSERNQTTWLYYSGWIHYHSGDISQAMAAWQQIKAQDAGLNSELTELMKAAKLEVLYGRMGRLELDQNLDLLLSQASPAYVLQANLRRGASELMLNRRPRVAVDYLSQAVSKLAVTPIPITYLTIAQLAIKPDSYSEKMAYANFLRQYGNTSLLAWLHALWVFEEKPLQALQQMIKAQNEGVGNRHFPPEGILTTLWLVIQLANNMGTPSNYHMAYPIQHFGSTKTEVVPFISATCISYAYWNLKKQTGNLDWLASYEPLIPSKNRQDLWKQVKGIYFALKQEWTRAADIVKEVPGNLALTILLHAIKWRIRQKDWEQASYYLAHGLQNNPRHPQLLSVSYNLRGYLHRRLWREGAYGALQRFFEDQLATSAGDSRLHHNLAVIYTHQAVAQDQGQMPDDKRDYWPLAIGHWAVVLSDEGYWERWAQERGTVYEDVVVLDELTWQRWDTIPRLLGEYLGEQADHSEPDEQRTARYRHYAALIKDEIQITTALRSGILFARFLKITLPEIVQRLISPLLVKTYHAEKEGRRAVQILNRLSLPEETRQQLNMAFSPFTEARLLAHSQQYPAALEKLYALEKSVPPGDNLYREVQTEITTTLHQYTNDLARSGRWDEAMDRVRVAYLQRQNIPGLELGYVETVCGWARHLMRAENYEKVIHRLREVRRDVSRSFLELDTLLAEALGRQGLMLVSEDVPAAQKLFDEALSIDPDHPLVRQGMAQIHVQKAFQIASEGSWESAITTGRRALEYSKNSEIVTSVAGLAHDFAVDLSLQGKYNRAIQVIEPLVGLPFDPERVPLLGLLSAIHTVYGTTLYNSGNQAEGEQHWRAALKHDPRNAEAARSLKNAGAK